MLGILKFFETHECNNICQFLQLKPLRQKQNDMATMIKPADGNIGTQIRKPNPKPQAQDLEQLLQKYPLLAAVYAQHKLKQQQAALQQLQQQAILQQLKQPGSPLPQLPVQQLPVQQSPVQQSPVQQSPEIPIATAKVLRDFTALRAVELTVKGNYMSCF